VDRPLNHPERYVPAVTARRSIGRTVIDMVLAPLVLLPNLLRHGNARDAAASVTGDPKEALLGDELATMHAPDGTVCTRCRQPFRPVDSVRRLKGGTVHDVCPP